MLLLTQFTGDIKWQNHTYKNRSLHMYFYCTGISINHCSKEFILQNLCPNMQPKFNSKIYSSSSSSSSLARQPLMGPGLLQKFCPFIPVKGDLLPILDLLTSHVLINSIFPSKFRSSNSSYSVRFGVEYFFKNSIIIHTHQVPSPC